MQLKYLSSDQSRKYEYIGDRVTRKYSLLNQNNYSFKKIQIFALSFYKSCKNTCTTPSPCALICTSVVHPQLLKYMKDDMQGEAGKMYRRCNDKVYRGKQEKCTGRATIKCTGRKQEQCTGGATIKCTWGSRNIVQEVQR